MPKTKPAKLDKRKHPTVRHKTAKARSKRSWRRRLSLHPLSLMVFLCCGVLLVASTISALGDAYTVTATVPAPLPPTAAVITDPADNNHTTNPLINVQGSCPAGFYVVLNLNGAQQGTSDCNGSFTISVSLQSGANQLAVQNYNILDQAGPSSPGITVYYDPPPTPTPPPADVAPVSLEVTRVDNGVGYISQQTVEQTTRFPTFAGIAPPYSIITVTVHTNPVTCVTKANSVGYWSCTLKTELPPGYHTVMISALTPAGQLLQFPTFHIMVVGSTPAKSQPASQPLELTAGNYKYQAYDSGTAMPLSGISISGGKPPYAISVDWGDGTTITTTQSAAGALQLNHSYQLTNAALKSFSIKIGVTDSVGTTTTLQTLTFIRNLHYQASSATTSKRPTGGLHGWLWLLWPAYIIITLMFISFWLGERRQYESDRRLSKKPPRRHA